MEAKKSPKANLDNKKMLFLEIGFIIALIVVFAAFEYRSYGNAALNNLATLQNYPDEILIPNTTQPVKLPPAPPKKITKINIVEDNDLVSENVDIDVLIDEATEIEKWVPPVQKDEVFDVSEPFTIVEKKPEFPGGYGQMYKYLAENIVYPEIAREIGISGTVFLNFIVEKDGSISSVKVLRGIGGGCDEEAVRVVQNMPKWNPGLQRGEPVRVSFNLPVKFTLQ